MSEKSMIRILPVWLLLAAAATPMFLDAAVPRSPPHVVFMVGEDEYRTWETLPEYARTELEPRGCRVTIVHADASDKNRFPGLKPALETADLLFVSVRRRTPPQEELEAIRAYLDAGKPLIGIRTASHAFARRPGESVEAPLAQWAGFDPEVLGGNYTGHHGNGPKTTVTVAPGVADHPLLQGIDPGALIGNGSLYKVSPLAPSATALLIGSIPDKPSEPIAWVRHHGPKRARIFYTSLGHPDDFKEPAFRRLLVNAVSYLVAGGLSAAEPALDPSKLSPPKRAAVPKLSGKLKMDGRLNESVWKQALVLKPFIPNSGSGQAREATEVRLWYDEEALYLGWRCVDSDIQATFTQRDSKFWEEEVVEFFVTPGILTRYFELQWNPLGGVFDAIIRNELGPDGVSRKFEGDWDYTAKQMTSAVRVKGTVGKGQDKDEYWQVEVRVPFSDLNQAPPKAGDVWRANFYRFNRGTGQPVEGLSWSPTQFPSFHQPARFGFLEFKGTR